jgi:hypothetical protein
MRVMTDHQGDGLTEGRAEPSSWVQVGASSEGDTNSALQDALGQLSLHRAPRLVLVFAAPHHDFGRIAEHLGSALPHSAVVGCSTAGEIASSGALSRSLVLWALGGSGITVCSGWGEAGQQGLRGAAADAAACLNGLQRRQHTVLLLLSDGLAGNQMEVVRGAYDVAHHDVPLVGGCAGDDLAMRRTRQLHGTRVLSNAVVAAAISSDQPLGVGVSHGWTPVSAPMLVTDSHDTRLEKLDDRAALDVYLDFFDPPQEVRDDPSAFAAFAATHPIGIRRRDRIEMRHITGWDAENRALLMVAEVPQGALAFLTQGDLDSVLKAAVTSTQDAIAGLGDCQPVGLLLFDCVSRRSIFGDLGLKEETARITESSGGVPMAGFYTYGEIARSSGSGGFHNQTLVTLAIG